jgi:hypothetical protein
MNIYGELSGGVSVRGEREKGKDRSEEDGCTIYRERERERANSSNTR